MTIPSESMLPGAGLALSGGGFRATLFHAGSLWRLNELGYLPKLDRVSSISGGSITAGLLGVRWNQLQFDAAGRAGNFEPLIVAPLRSFCSRDIDAIAIGEGAMLPWKTAADFVEREYRRHLLGDATVQQLPDHPRFVINATNCATGVSFRFSKPYAGDYRIGLIPNPTFRVATAVTASSAFPPVLSPVTLECDPAAFQKTDGADLYDDVDYRKRLVLSDGGVYDNFGLETICNRCTTVLVSDAGAPFQSDETPRTTWMKLALRALDIMGNQSRALRKRMLIDGFERGRKGTYWGIATPIARYRVPDTLPVRSEWTAVLAGMRTRLNRFDEGEQCRLINWGYAVTDAAVRRWLALPNSPQAAWPYPAFALDRK